MQDLIEKYKLVPHPEGGYYAVVYESKQKVIVEAPAYDAGSERNSEDCDYIPGPPCNNSPAHDPADAEGYVHIHAGIHGIGPDPSVDPAMHDWRNPVAKITIRRIYH